MTGVLRKGPRLVGCTTCSLSPKNTPYATIENMNPPQVDSANPQEDALSPSADAISTRTLRPNASADMAFAAENHTITNTDCEYEVAEVKPLPTSPIRRLPSTPLVRPERQDWVDLSTPLPATSADDCSASSLTEELVVDRAGERY